jgi:hypothetical protein
LLRCSHFCSPRRDHDLRRIRHRLSRERERERIAEQLERALRSESKLADAAPGASPVLVWKISGARREVGAKIGPASEAAGVLGNLWPPPTRRARLVRGKHDEKFLSRLLRYTQALPKGSATGRVGM